MFRAASVLIGQVWAPDVYLLRKEPAGLEQGSGRLLGLGTQLDTQQAEPGQLTSQVLVPIAMVNPGSSATDLQGLGQRLI